MKHGVGLYLWPNGEVCYTMYSEYTHYNCNQPSTFTMHCYAKVGMINV